jgi:hypothetical protein
MSIEPARDARFIGHALGFFTGLPAIILGHTGTLIIKFLPVNSFPCDICDFCDSVL